jgi:hypothetical protein
MKYEAVIPCADKDRNKAKYAIASAAKYLDPPPGVFHVIGQSNFFVGVDCEFWHEDEVLPTLNPMQSRFRRPRWIYQQFLKLFNDVTTSSNYMVIDSDIVFNKPTPVCSPDGKPYFHLGINHQHPPDQEFVKHIFDVPSVYPHSFTVEFMLINKLVRNIMLASMGGLERFYNKVCEIVNEHGQPYRMNDYETYGNFVHWFFPEQYEMRHIKSKLFHTYGNDWAPDAIEARIKAMEPTEFDVFTYHTWV